jgi:hypothetical protein
MQSIHTVTVWSFSDIVSRLSRSRAKLLLLLLCASFGFISWRFKVDGNWRRCVLELPAPSICHYSGIGDCSGL